MPGVSKLLLLGTAAVLYLGGAGEVCAQMKSGSGMRDYYKVLGLDEKRRDYNFRATLFRSNEDANVFFPGEQPELEFQVRNLIDRPLKGNARVILMHWGTANVPGDIWQPLVYSADGVVETIPLTVEIPARGYHNFTIKPKLPDKFGGYALLFELDGEGRQFLSSIVRAAANQTRLEQFPKQASEFFPPAAMKKLGLQAIRFGVPFHLPGTPERERTMADLARVFAEMKKNHVVATVQIGAGSPDHGQPLGMVRPHLDDDGVMQQTKSDFAWLPEYDEDFRKFCYELIRDYGFPRGPINGIMLWNEPWEGISISGWGADMIRYRDLYRIMGEATHQANRETGSKVLVGGCDSSSNTLDKLFPNESDEFEPYLDFCSIHYQGLWAPSLYRKWIDRKPQRVLIWDTESWVANSEDLLPGVIAANRAAGYDRSMGFYGGYVFDNIAHNATMVQTAPILTEQGEVRTPLPLVAYPMAAGVAAMQKFIGNREFRGILFNGLPWLFVFDGEGGDREDGTVVVLGDLNSLFDQMALFQQVRPLRELQEKATLRKQLETLQEGTPEWTRLSETYRTRFPNHGINERNFKTKLTSLLNEPWPFREVVLELDADGPFALFDVYGNPVAPQDGKFRIPLDNRGFYLRSTGPGGFDALLRALTLSRTRGLEALELVPRDFLTPVQPGARMTVSLRNVTNRPLTGVLFGTVGELQLRFPERIELKPFEQREVELEVTGGPVSSTNQYPLFLTFRGEDGAYAEVRDVMHANVIARRTIKVDGKLEDWEGVLPQIVSADPGRSVSQMEKAWLPFIKFEENDAAGISAAYLAYDQDYFYFAAKVADTTPDLGMMRFETRDDDRFFYPEVSYRYDQTKTFNYAIESESAKVAAGCGVELPDAPGKRTDKVIRPRIERLRLELTLPTDRLTRVTLYFPWGDFRSGRGVQLFVYDQKGRELVGRRELWNVKDGAFVTYELAGQVAVEIVNPRTWHQESGRLGGVFFDPGEESAKFQLRDGGFARLLGVDETRPGLWQGRFGKLGVMLPGLEFQRFSPGIAARFRDDEVKQELVWPEGVRRYSYRRRTELPDGQSPAADNVQLAFMAIPEEENTLTVPNLPGRMPGFVNLRPSDYEFALNPVAETWGGGTEIWKLAVPGTFRKHFYPRQPKSQWEGPVRDGKLEIRHEGNTRIVEAAIPWSAMPEVKALMTAGKPVRFSFRINDNRGAALELGQGRAATRYGRMTFHPDWKTCYTNELEFSFGK